LAWSPDSRWIFFTASSGDDWSLYQLAADGSELKAIPGPIMSDISFAVSPDGNYLVIVSSDLRTGYSLSVLTTDGGNPLVLLKPVNDAGLTICAAAPVWLPETNAILFIAAKMGESCHIYRMNIDGSGLEKFYDGPEALGSLTVYYTN
jgi:Tol biopolymer transport system component